MIGFAPKMWHQNAANKNVTSDLTVKKPCGVYMLKGGVIDT